MKRKRIWLGLLLTIGIAGLAFAVRVWMEQFDEQRKVLSDGSEIVIRAVTYGREHRMPTGTVWQRLVGRLLPPALAKRFGTSFQSYSSTNHTLVVWWENVTTGTARPAFLAADARIADAQGNVFAAEGNSGSMPMAQFRANVFNLLPRESKEISVQFSLYNFMNSRQERLEFVVRNPAYRMRSLRNSGSVLSLVTTARIDDVEVVLEGMQNVPPPPGPSSGWEWTRVEAQFYVGGKPTPNWRLCGIEVFDETGGSYRPGTRSGGVAVALQSVPPQLSFIGTLSSNQVWKVRLFVCRVDRFSTNELWTLPDIPLEGLARATFAPRSNTVNGCSVILYDVSGRPRELKLVLIPPDEAMAMVLCDVTDDQGERHAMKEVLVAQPRQRGGYSGYNFPLRRDLTSKTVSATFAVTRVRYVDMIVKPSALSKSGASPNSPSPAIQ